MRRLAILLLAAFVLMMAGCAKTLPTPGKHMVRSIGEKGKWMSNPSGESTKTHKAFVGVSRQYATETDARSDARLDGYKQAIDDMGKYGEHKLDEVISQAGMGAEIVDPAVVSDQVTKLKAKGVAMGDAHEYYIEYWEDNSQGSPEGYYVTYCLFLMPRDAAKQFMQDLARQIRDADKTEKNKALLERATEKLLQIEATDW